MMTGAYVCVKARPLASSRVGGVAPGSASLSIWFEGGAMCVCVRKYPACLVSVALQPASKKSRLVRGASGIIA